MRRRVYERRINILILAAAPIAAEYVLGFLSKLLTQSTVERKTVRRVEYEQKVGPLMNVGLRYDGAQLEIHRLKYVQHKVGQLTQKKHDHKQHEHERYHVFIPFPDTQARLAFARLHNEHDKKVVHDKQRQQRYHIRDYDQIDVQIEAVVEVDGEGGVLEIQPRRVCFRIVLVVHLVVEPEWHAWQRAEQRHHRDDL